MGRTILEVQPLDAPFGAVVSGMDFGQALDAETHTAIRAALHEYRMLVFRGESRPDAKLVFFAEFFGSLITLYEHDTTVPGYPGIVRVSNASRLGVRFIRWSCATPKADSRPCISAHSRPTRLSGSGTRTRQRY